MKIGWLGDISRESAGAYGSKGANLGEMVRLGLPVPPGGVVPVSAYEAHVGRRGLAGKLAPLLEDRNWIAIETVAREVIDSGPLDGDTSAGLSDAYRRLGASLVAVRSSATAEDLSGASFAGQYDTILDVQGEEDLAAAIRGCWASLWCRRALEYRDRRSIDHLSCGMAVIIQIMLPSEAGGVVFTKDPLTRRDDTILIQCASGQAGAVVEGGATGGVYRVDRSTLEIVESDRDVPPLSPRDLSVLCRWALDLEAHFGSPQDVEFALAGGRLYLLQTRPITTFDRLVPESLEPPGRPRFLERVVKPLVAERFVVSPRPLDNITYTRLVGASVHSLRRNGVRVTAEDEAAFRSEIWRQAYRYPRHRLTWRFLGAGIGQLRVLGSGLLSWWQSGPARRLREAARSIDPARSSDADLLEKMDEILVEWEGALNSRMYAVSALQWETWLRGLVTLAVGRRRSSEVMTDLLSGMSYPTLEVNRELWRLSREARRSPSLLAAVRDRDPQRLRRTEEGREFLTDVEKFLGAYGHREGACWYLSTPTWRQDPAQFWRLLRGMVEAHEPPDHPSRPAARVEAARRLVERRLRFLPGLPACFRWLLAAIRDLTAFREHSHFDLTRPLVPLQAIAAEWGRRLVERGVLETTDDVYYLTHDEVRSWLLSGPPDPEAVRDLVARRRTTYRLANARWQADRAGGGTRRREATGIGTSAGVARGRARIVRGEEEFDRLEPGEILVCPHTNPSWTVLFASAAAIVTETGGPASHAAIVAREYGIPAVMAVRAATRFIKDGDEILVDGHQGIVRQLGRVRGA